MEGVSSKGEAEISDIGGFVHICREGDVAKIQVVDSQMKKAHGLSPRIGRSWSRMGRG
jgi:hypothetical protein